MRYMFLVAVWWSSFPFNAAILVSRMRGFYCFVLLCSWLLYNNKNNNISNNNFPIRHFWPCLVLDEIATDSLYDGGIHTLMRRFEPSLRTDSVYVWDGRANVTLKATDYFLLYSHYSTLNDIYIYIYITHHTSNHHHMQANAFILASIFSELTFFPGHLVYFSGRRTKSFMTTWQATGGSQQCLWWRRKSRRSPPRSRLIRASALLASERRGWMGRQPWGEEDGWSAGQGKGKGERRGWWRSIDT